MQEKYADKGLLLIAIHRQDAALKTNVLSLAAQRGVNYSITQQGGLQGDNSRGIPRAFVFDWTGKKTWEGHPSQMDSQIEALAAKAPHWLTKGRELTDKSVLAQAQKLYAKGGYAGILKSLSDIAAKEPAAGDASGATRVEEAKYLHDNVLGYGTAALAKAKTNERDDPIAAQDSYKELASLFKGHEIGDNAKTRLAELAKDKDFKDELEAAKLYQQIQDLVPKLKPGGATEKSNAETIAIMTQYAQRLSTKYPTSVAAGKARQLASSLGISYN